MYFQTKDKRTCCGCTACEHVCPQRCISMQTDEEGFAYPVIDKAACINCHACERVCPIANPADLTDSEPESFAAIPWCVACADQHR
ncbi:MAG: 4Fe-4S dicluster domain-containing protein [Prevotella sp.]|nr:4Fe-4S dicluster domain-containing protein [Prevotella sp.]